MGTIISVCNYTTNNIHTRAMGGYLNYTNVMPDVNGCPDSDFIAQVVLCINLSAELLESRTLLQTQGLTSSVEVSGPRNSLGYFMLRG